jgi:hypothetical protein
MTETTTGYVPGAPDITWGEDPRDCPSRGNEAWFCTRSVGHPMPHAAGTGRIIGAIWDDEGMFAQVGIS